MIAFFLWFHLMNKSKCFLENKIKTNSLKQLVGKPCVVWIPAFIFLSKWCATFWGFLLWFQRDLCKHGRGQLLMVCSIFHEDCSLVLPSLLVPMLISKKMLAWLQRHMWVLRFVPDGGGNCFSYCRLLYWSQVSILCQFICEFYHSSPELKLSHMISQWRWDD